MNQNPKKETSGGGLTRELKFGSAPLKSIHNTANKEAACTANQTKCVHQKKGKEPLRTKTNTDKEKMKTSSSGNRFSASRTQKSNATARKGRDKKQTQVPKTKARRGR